MGTTLSVVVSLWGLMVLASGLTCGLSVAQGVPKDGLPRQSKWVAKLSFGFRGFLVTVIASVFCGAFFGLIIGTWTHHLDTLTFASWALFSAMTIELTFIRELHSVRK